ncbi:YueH family protein [Bacillus sp. FJAT-49736]|uniref:YueH family protein n=1 Tax=Bacillus sp. FJAT-49736 TaxID=2833582 RepID=UPI001BC92405|nr:YueH family protein [Bacillus sp. FJAT-49736]MBS4172288.1 YueH family protein [Bacillus sp. FJAT-49736]
MKIRKTAIVNQQDNIFIYENKKDDYFVVAVPSIEWSTYFTYDDERHMLLSRWENSLKEKINEVQAKELSLKIFGWTREM